MLLLQAVQNLLALPAQVHAMVQGGIPWWQIMYTGLMSTDAVLMIEVGAHLPKCTSPDSLTLDVLRS